MRKLKEFILEFQYSRNSIKCSLDLSVFFFREELYHHLHHDHLHCIVTATNHFICPNNRIISIESVKLNENQVRHIVQNIFMRKLEEFILIVILEFQCKKTRRVYTRNLRKLEESISEICFDVFVYFPRVILFSQSYTRTRTRFPRKFAQIFLYSRKKNFRIPEICLELELDIRKLEDQEYFLYKHCFLSNKYSE